MRSKVNRSLRDGGFDVILNPLLKNIEFKDSSICYFSIEVGIIKRISCICKSDSSCVTSELLNAVFDSKEVSSRFGHLFIIQNHVSITEHSLGHHLVILPNGGVIIQRHCQVVSNQVFTRDSKVHRVPELEFVSHFVKFLLRDLAALLIIFL